MHLLAISGSLRSRSSNTALVHAVARVLPDGHTLSIYDGLAVLPAFNPDLDVEPALLPVAAWRDELKRAAAVVISSPEYAHGVPGVLKNALDWIVSSGEFMDKPVAIVNASAQSKFVTDQLTETLTVMMARVVVADAIPLESRPEDAAELLADATAAEHLRQAVAKLVTSATG